jgi:hypothetical protein
MKAKLAQAGQINTGTCETPVNNGDTGKELEPS